MRDKRAALGDYLDLVYRVAVITITVAIIFGTYVFAFKPTIDIKDSEALILQKKIYNCFNENGSFDLNKFKESENKLFETCSINIGESDEERYYVKIRYLDENGDLLGELDSGDSGKGWVESVVQNKKDNSWEYYYPGKSNMTYSIFSNGKIEKLNIEVVINEI